MRGTLVKDACLARTIAGNCVPRGGCALGWHGVLSTEPACEMAPRTVPVLGLPSETLRLPHFCFMWVRELITFVWLV